MNDNTNRNIIIGIIGIAIGLFIAWQLITIITYVIISLVLSLIGGPIFILLKKIKIKNKNLPDSICAGVSLFFLLSAFIAICSVSIPIILTEARIISNINTENLLQIVDVPVRSIERNLNNYGLLQDEVLDWKQALKNRIIEIVNISDLTKIFGSLANSLGNFFIAFFSISFITFFFLKERTLFPRLLLASVPDAHVAKVTNILNNANHMLSRYLIGLLIQVSSISILVSLGLSMLGVANAFIIGFFAGLMNVVPYVGPLIGIIVGLVLGITSNLHLEISTELLPLSLKIFSVFMVVQLLDNFLFQPLIFSNSVKSHPLEIFIVVLSAGTLGGIVGLIVAIPLYTIFRIVAKEFLSQYKLIQKITKNL